LAAFVVAIGGIARVAGGTFVRLGGAAARGTGGRGLSLVTGPGYKWTPLYQVLVRIGIVMDMDSAREKAGREIRRAALTHGGAADRAIQRGVDSFARSCRYTIDDGASPVFQQFKRDLSKLTRQYSMEAADGTFSRPRGAALPASSARALLPARLRAVPT